MAFRHQVRIITRTPDTVGGRPHSVAAALAYRLKAALRDPAGRLINYSRGRHVVRLGVQAPVYAQGWTHDPQRLADAVERAIAKSTRRADARLGREDIMSLDRRLSLDAMRRVVREFGSVYAAEGEVVLSAIHLYGDPLPATSERGQHAYAEAEAKRWPVLDGHDAPAPEEPHLRRIVSRTGRAWLLIYAPHAHVVRTTRVLLADGAGFGLENRSRNSASVVAAARLLSCDLQNAELVAAGFPGDLDHRSRRARGDPTPVRPYLKRGLYNVATAASRGRRAYEIDEREAGVDWIRQRAAVIVTQQALASALPDPFEVAGALLSPRAIVTLAPSRANAAFEALQLERILPALPTQRGLHDDLSPALASPSHRSPTDEQYSLATLAASIAGAEQAIRLLARDARSRQRLPARLSLSREHRWPAGVAQSCDRGDLLGSVPEAVGPEPRAVRPGPARRPDDLRQHGQPPAGGAHPSFSRDPGGAAADPVAAAGAGEPGHDRLKIWVERGMAHSCGILARPPDLPTQPTAPERRAFDAGVGAVEGDPSIRWDAQQRTAVIDTVARRIAGEARLDAFMIAVEELRLRPHAEVEQRLRREALELGADPYLRDLMQQPGYGVARRAIERAERMSARGPARERGGRSPPAASSLQQPPTR